MGTGSYSQGQTMFMKDPFGVASSCDKFGIGLPGAYAFSAFKDGYGGH